MFTRENVAALARDLEARGLRPTGLRLGSDVFNELSLQDPAGNRLRVLEARTFSPPLTPAATRLGQFEALSLPCDDPVESRDYWQQLGWTAVEGAASEQPVLRGQGLLLTLHPRAQDAGPLLRFGPAQQQPTRHTLPGALLALTGAAPLITD